ncbi:hypothetical protein H9P43_007200 [Blastocladiella emersonii ATCC 22665]|nr:hypothetical protein H9P43_007200 [Blastocladiella emersonii ATCC 22665]
MNRNLLDSPSSAGRHGFSLRLLPEDGGAGDLDLLDHDDLGADMSLLAESPRPQHAALLDDRPGSALGCLASTVNAPVIGGRPRTIKEHERELEALRKEVLNYKFKIYHMEQAMHLAHGAGGVNTLIIDNTNLKLHVKRLAEENARLRDDVQAAELGSGEATRHRETEHALQDRVTALSELNKKLEMQLLDVRHQARELEDHAAHAREQRESAAAELQLANADVNALRADLEMADAEIRNLRERLVEAGVDAANGGNRRGSKSSRRRDSASPSPDTKALRTQLGHMQAQVAAQNLLQAARETDLAAANQRVTTLSREVDALQRELDALRATGHAAPYSPARESHHVAALREQLGELNRQLGSRTTDVEALNRELEAQKRNHDSAMAGLMEAWTSEKKDLLAKFSKARRRIEEADARTQEMRLRAAEAEEKLEAATARAASESKGADAEAMERDADLAHLAAELDRLTQLVQAKNLEVAHLQQEITDRVRSESDLRDELAVLQRKAGSTHSAAKVTSSTVAQLESELARTTAKLREIEQRWRDEVTQRCAVEQRELSRIADLDAQLRAQTARCTELERHLQSAEADLRVADQIRDGDAAAAADTAARAADAEHKRETETYRRQLAKLERACTEARHHARRLAKELGERDAELAAARTQLAQWQAEASEHHDRLTAMAAENAAAMARHRAGKDDAYTQLEDQFRALQREHADTLAVLRAKPTASSDSAVERDLLLKIFHRLSTVLGQPPDGVSAATPTAFLHEQVLHRVGQVARLHSDFESRVKKVEDHWASEFKLFMAKLDRKMGQIDRSETAIRTVTAQVKQLKEAVPRLKAEADDADRRRRAAEQHAAKVHAKLEAFVRGSGGGEGAGGDVALWRAKVADLEAQKRAADDRVRQERAGAQKKVDQLIQTVRELERDLEAANKMNVEYQGLLHHQRTKLEAALAAPSERKLDRLREELRDMHHHHHHRVPSPSTSPIPHSLRSSPHRRRPSSSTSTASTSGQAHLENRFDRMLRLDDSRALGGLVGSATANTTDPVLRRPHSAANLRRPASSTSLGGAFGGGGSRRSSVKP